MAVQGIFHFQGADVLATRDDDVLAAVADLHIPVAFNHRQVAGVKPPAFECFLGGAGVFQITLHHDVAAKHDLAHGLAIGGNLSHGFRVHHRHALLQLVAHPLAAIEAGLLGHIGLGPTLALDRTGCWAIHLGQTIDMGDVKTNVGHALDHGCRWGRTRHHATHAARHSLAQGRVGLDDQVVHDGGRAVVVHPVLAHGLQNRCRVDLAQTHMGAAEHGHGPRKTPTIAMKHRQGPQVARKVRHGPCGGIAHRIQVSPPVVGDHALGVARGARCVRHRDRVPLVNRAWQLRQRWVGGQPIFVVQAAHALASASELAVTHIDHGDLATVHLVQGLQGQADGGRKLGVGDQHRCLAMVHLPGDQIGIESGVQSIEHRVECGYSVMQLDHFGGVVQHHTDRGPPPDTQTLQSRGQPGRAFAHLGPGIAALSVDDGGQIAIHLGTALNKTHRRQGHMVGVVFVQVLFVNRCHGCLLF